VTQRHHLCAAFSRRIQPNPSHSDVPAGRVIGRRSFASAVFPARPQPPPNRGTFSVWTFSLPRTQGPSIFRYNNKAHSSDFGALRWGSPSTRRSRCQSLIILSGIGSVGVSSIPSPASFTSDGHRALFLRALSGFVVLPKPLCPRRASRPHSLQFVPEPTSPFPLIHSSPGRVSQPPTNTQKNTTNYLLTQPLFSNFNKSVSPFSLLFFFPLRVNRGSRAVCALAETER